MATQNGFEVRVKEVDRSDDPWDVTASQDMVPSAENIAAVEERLDGLAREQGGMSDDWGFERTWTSNDCLRPMAVIYMPSDRSQRQPVSDAQ